MFSFFRRSFRQWARGSETGTAKPTARRLHCEALEDRTLPTVTIGSSLVNTTRPGADMQAATATSGNGSSVVVWTEMKGTVDCDIMAQRYDALGRKAGGEITVATGRNPQHNPSVAMDGYGSFAVVWTEDFSSTDSDIHGALFRADGTKIGNGFTVAETPQREYDPSVGRAANGDFVVSYTYQFGRNDLDIKAVQYRSNCTVARTINVANGTYVEEHSHVAVAADGRFAVAYQALGNVYVSRYTSTGTRVGWSAVGATSRTESNASIGMDNRGDVLVAWQEQNGRDSNIMARAINSAGVMGRAFLVWGTPAYECNPAVAVDPNTGKSVIAWQSQSGSVPSVQVMELNERQSYVRTWTMGTGMSSPALSAGGPWHRFVLAAQSGRTSYDWDGGVFASLSTL